MVGHFTGTTGKAVEDTITRLRGEVLSKDKALGLSKRHSSTPNCFVVLKNDTELLRATKRENSSASGSDSDTCLSITQRKTAPAKIMKKATNQGSVRVCREFAVTDFKFLSIAYIQDVEKKGCVLDPTEYLFAKGAIERACVKDQRPLFERQRNPKISNLNYRS